MSTRKISRHSSVKVLCVLYYKRNIKHFFRIDIDSYLNTRENWKNSKLYENTPPCGRRVSTQFLVFPISTRVDITVYQHGKCFIFLKYRMYTPLCKGWIHRDIHACKFEYEIL